MNIAVSVDEVSLASVIQEPSEYHDGRTLGDAVAERLVKRITSDGDTWTPFRDKVTEIRDEEIRKAVAPLIAEALTRSIQLTDSWGGAKGPSTTLAEIIVAEARKQLTQKTDNAFRSDGQSVVQKLVATEVQKAFAELVTAEVAKARDLVSDQIGQHVAAAVKAGMAKR